MAGGALSRLPGLCWAMTEYVCLGEGLAFVPVGAGYVVDGGNRREHVTGRLARELLPQLIPLLDGTRTADQVADALNLPAQYARRVIALLAQRDLVRLQATPASGDPGSPLASFLRRSYPLRADGIWRRLQGATVAVTCGQPLTGLDRKSVV